MNKTSKIILAVALGIALGYGVNAARSYVVWDVALAQNGQLLPHPGFEGKSYSTFASTTEALICTGRCLIYDVIMTSGADGSYAVLADTTAVNGSGTAIVSKLEFDGTGHGSLSGNNPNAFPFVTTLGLTADLSSVASGEELLILYKDLD